MKHRYKSIDGAVRRIRQLEKLLRWYENFAKQADRDKLALAKLAADTPQFFNPLVVMEAKRLRDAILKKAL